MAGADLWRRGALPTEYTSFVDRKALLASARSSLGQTRLLTIVGAGGVGKTRFAIRVAQTVRRQYPDGCWFVDLSGVSGSGSVADEVARTLDVRAVREPLAAITHHFGETNGLLVLDNCEHVIDQCATLVAALLKACPQIKVIATSREVLRLSAEKVFELEPLDATGTSADTWSPAAALFVERASAMMPAPTAPEREAIAEICRRLDGLPLAIELAAARVRVLAPTELLARLEAPLAFLANGDRDAPARQQTIRSAISWSYDLCTPEEQTLWRRLSVFTAGWDMESAEAMIADGEDGAALDLVQSLMEKSIIVRRPRSDIVYYRMLDTVRHFGLEAATDEELDAAGASLRDWYLKRLERLEAEWYGPDQAYWLAMTRIELPNLRAAIDYCVSHRDAERAARLLISGWRIVWQAHGLMGEFYRWGMKVLALGEPSTVEGCQLLIKIGALEATRGDRDAAQRLLERAAVLAEALDDDFCRAWIVDERATIHFDQETPVMWRRALAVAGDVAGLHGRTNLEERIAIGEYIVGHLEEAARRRQLLIDRGLRVGDSFETGYLLLISGLTSPHGASDEAVTMLRQALSLAQNLAEPFILALVEEALAYAASNTPDAVRAATLLGVTDLAVGTDGAVKAAFPQFDWSREQIESTARAALGDRAFQAAFDRGKDLTQEEGVAYALGVQLPGMRASERRTKNSSELTARESQVAALVGEGLTDREVAERLVISRRTAEGHVASSLMKLGFSSRAQLAAWTVQKSLEAEQER
ncbi:hypothetical protein KNO15_12050 [Leifsonia shinshuensis]|uniref:ATP-binding protein n=1 Tax=Leifsonia shinshuensis TaxID=150026 RepID=UPI001F5075E4|nr:LuxR C-terminal-related transcriptional regulator [Leifsonia shinshuensis]MCI0157425.1 hypothetical protein [Leifsonia shinshuensis]